MNRRKFLKWLGAGAAVGVVAPTVLLKKEPANVWKSPVSYNTMGLQPEGGWVSYRIRYTVTYPPTRTWRIRHIEAA